MNARHKHFVEPFMIVLAHFEGKESLGGNRHAVVDKTKQDDDSPHDVVDTIVLNTQRLQYHSRRVQSYTHHECHAEIQHCRIPRHALVVRDIGRHTGYQRLSSHPKG